MALIHEKLYQSGDLSRIDIADYVRLLATHLVSVYHAEGAAIGLSVDIKDVYLDINRAIPLGLIVNELVTNALKHGLKKKKSGEVSVRMRKIEVGGVERKRKDEVRKVEISKKKRKKVKAGFELVVSDTGKGLPEGFDLSETESFGMQLVTDLVKQLEGSIELKQKDIGSEFVIRF
jgi:two-component sensor histidine kinase